VAVVLRIDDDLRKKKDPEILPVLMARPAPMVTIDAKLPWKHTDKIPESNPGIITVGYSRYSTDRKRETLRTLTTTAAARMLRRLKDLCPHWHSLPVRNSIVEITNKEVVVYHVENGKLLYDEHFTFGDDDKNLEAKLTAKLQTNAHRKALPPPGPASLPPPPPAT
jgi:hypothetical protein